MVAIAPDRSRDARIEDPTNLWIIHPAARSLVPVAIGAHISANMVSLFGLALGIGAAWAYARWDQPAFATLGFLLMILWLIADGLDGMVARATNSASALGRFLDGLCDHGVFILVYVTIATTIGTREGWALAIIAGAAHAAQSNLFESERARFHRRIRGDGGLEQAATSANPILRGYDAFARPLGQLSAAFDATLRRSSGSEALGLIYAGRAVAPMRLLALLSANTRVIVIFLACLAGNPRYFWWFEIVPMSLVTLFGILWHRRAVAGLSSPAGRDRVRA